MKIAFRHFWKLHRMECIQECPSGYVEDENDKWRCKKCDGPCPLGNEFCFISHEECLCGSQL